MCLCSTNVKFFTTLFSQNNLEKKLENGRDIKSIKNQGGNCKVKKKCYR